MDAPPDTLDDLLEALSAGDSLAASVDMLLRKTAELLDAPVAWCLLVTPAGTPLISLRIPPTTSASAATEPAVDLYVESLNGRMDRGRRIDDCLLRLLDEAAKAEGPTWATGPKVAALKTGEAVVVPIGASSLSGILVAGSPGCRPKSEAFARFAHLKRPLGNALSIVHRRQGLWETGRRRDTVAAVLSSIVGLPGADEIASATVTALRVATGWPAVSLWHRRDDELFAEAQEPPDAVEPGLLVSEALQTGRTRLGDDLDATGGGWRGVEFAVPISGRSWGDGVLSLATTGVAPFTVADVALVEELAASVASALARGAAHDTAQSVNRLNAALAEQSADLLMVTDRAGVIQQVNRAFEQHSGWSREELAGRTPSVLRSGVHPRSIYEDLWKTILSGLVYRGTLVNRTRDGRLYHEEKTIAPIRDEKGRVSHFVSVGRDISDRIAAELRQAELKAHIERAAAEWSATFDAVQFPMLILDAYDQVARANVAARDLAKTTFGDLIGEPLPRGAEEPWPSIRQAVRHARQRSNVPLLLPVLTEAPAVVWDVTAHILPKGVLTEHIIVVARDMTLLVRLQEFLRRSETMATLGSIVAGVAHEVRNPLFAITAVLEAFEAEFAGVPAFPEFQAVLRSECERLTAFMNDLLEYGRPCGAVLEPGAIGDVVQRSVRSLEAVARNADVELATDISADLPRVAIDHLRIGEVFVNLIENAIQHSPRGGRVSVRAGLAGESGVRVTIEDQGPGLRPEIASRVFEPFFTTRRRGTGLGLAIVRRILDEHGGHVRIENGPERGVVATVDLGGGPAGSR